MFVKGQAVGRGSEAFVSHAALPILGVVRCSDAINDCAQRQQLD